MFREVLYKKLSTNTLYLDDFDQRDAFTNNIIPKLIEKNVIGQGAVGKVYLIDDYVVKQTQPCMNKKKALYKYCEDFMQLGDNKIKVIPGGNKKYRYIMPNLLSEITVGSIINNIGFTKTITSMVLYDRKEDLSVYTVMEKLTPLNDAIKTKQHLYCMLFQVAHTLLNTQQQYKFTHYDLHTDNVLIRSIHNNEMVLLPYKLNDMMYYLKTTQIATIIDYGRSFITYKGEPYGVAGDRQRGDHR